MSGKMQKYCDATQQDLARVLDAADALYGCIAEFPDDPSCWGERLEQFDIAMEACPGTSAHYHKQAQRRAQEMDEIENPYNYCGKD